MAPVSAALESPQVQQTLNTPPWIHPSGYKFLIYQHDIMLWTYIQDFVIIIYKDPEDMIYTAWTMILDF